MIARLFGPSKPFVKKNLHVRTWCLSDIEPGIETTRGRGLPLMFPAAGVHG